MNHHEVYEQFKKQFRNQVQYVSLWFQNGKNSIRIRMSGRDYIYTYNGPADWRFETVDSYINNTMLPRGGKD